jgi:hypothetical protein
MPGAAIFWSPPEPCGPLYTRPHGTAFSIRSCEDLLYAADLPILQPYFDAVGMVRRRCQDVFDHASGQLAGGLILFQDDENCLPGLDRPANVAVHGSGAPSQRLRRCWMLNRRLRYSLA